MKRIASTQVAQSPKYEQFDALARDLKDQLQQADFGTARISFRLYSKGNRAKGDRDKVEIPLPEIEIYFPNTEQLRASSTPLNEVFTALVSPRTHAFLQTLSQFYPLTDTFFIGKSSKVKNMMSLQLKRGTRTSTSASSAWWDMLELVATIGDLVSNLT